MAKAELTIGDSIEVKTERLAYGGEAIARYQGLAVFVQGGVPGDSLRVRIIERKKSFARAVVEEILTPSQARREPPCKYFGQCGGCQLQHINYETQLSEKVGFIRDALKRTGKIDWPGEIKIHSANEFDYRLRAKIKIEPVFENNRTARVANPRPKEIRIGFRQARSHQVCDIEQCKILLPELNQALQSIRAEFNRPEDWSENFPEEIEIADIQGCRDELKVEESGEAIVNAIHSDKLISYEIGGAFYQFTPSTFFQANALLLNEFVKEAVGTEKGDFAIDLYAGVGLFTIPLARNFRQVIGVESNPHSVEFARRNMTTNAVENAEVVCQRTDGWLKKYLGQTDRRTPDLVLLDPPRSGAAEAIDLLRQLNPQRIHYVSCDPLTLARDLKGLVESNYEIERIVAFDMFPQTYHVETIVFLTKSSYRSSVLFRQ
jgi:23S rRNA (uracil1939-C5)-methyltransferase